MGKGRVYEPHTRCDLKQWKTMFFQKIKEPTLNCLFLSANPTNCLKIFKNPEATVISFWNFMKTWHKDFFYFELKKK